MRLLDQDFSSLQALNTSAFEIMGDKKVNHELP